MKVGDKGSGGCILRLLGGLISICSFLGLVGVTVSIFFHRRHNVFVSSNFFGDAILGTFICPKGEVKKEASLPERWRVTRPLGEKGVVGCASLTNERGLRFLLESRRIGEGVRDARLPGQQIES